MGSEKEGGFFVSPSFLDKEYDSSKDIGIEAKRTLEAQIGISGKTLSEAIGFLVDFYDLEIKDVTK